MCTQLFYISGSYFVAAPPLRPAALPPTAHLTLPGPGRAHDLRLCDIISTEHRTVRRLDQSGAQDQRYTRQGLFI